MHLRTSFPLLVLACLSVLAPGLLVSRASAQLLVAYAGHNETAAPMWVGIEAGLFKKRGLDVAMLQLRSGPVLMATLASGSVQLVYSASSSAINAASGGLGIRCLAFPVNRVARELVARKEIKSLEELRGRVFGVQSIGGGFWLQTMLLLNHLNLDPEKYQIKLRIIGDTATITQALIAGQIDAAVLPYSFSERAKRAGFHPLANAGELKGALQLTGLCAQRDFVAQSRDTALRLVQGMVEAVVFIHDPRNKAEVSRVLKKHLRFDSAEDTETSYRVLRQVSTLDVDLNAEAWKTTQRIMARVNPKVAQADLEQLLDRSLVRQLEENGFLPEMRKKIGEKSG
ncbi:MAG TPA: ABC transporter substrate-binding protein [candidate division Zixibacteria bacterium]|nr:ABC transporter substrate-binding protein [candidate division Zixibacteria bacterium]